MRREVEVLVDRLPYVTLLLRVRGNSETERWALDRRREFDHVVAGLVAQAAVEGDVRADVDPAWSRGCCSAWSTRWSSGTTPARRPHWAPTRLADAVVRQAFGPASPLTVSRAAR